MLQLLCSLAEQIVHRVPEVLLTAEVALCRLNGGMAQQELNLLDLAAASVAQLRARPAQVVRCDVL